MHDLCTISQAQILAFSGISWDLCKYLCWENISIVVINNKIVFFVTRFFPLWIQETYCAINLQQ